MSGGDWLLAFSAEIDTSHARCAAALADGTAIAVVEPYRRVLRASGQRQADESARICDMPSRSTAACSSPAAVPCRLEVLAAEIARSEAATRRAAGSASISLRVTHGWLDVSLGRERVERGDGRSGRRKGHENDLRDERRESLPPRTSSSELSSLSSEMACSSVAPRLGAEPPGRGAADVNGSGEDSRSLRWSRDTADAICGAAA